MLKLKYLIGKKVMAVKKCANKHLYADIKFPNKGEIYTIRDVVIYNEKVAYLLEEIRNERTVSNGITREPFFSKDIFKIISDGDLQEANDAVNALLYSAFIAHKSKKDKPRQVV